MGSDKYGVEALGPANYATWRIQFKAYAIAKDFWDGVTGLAPEKSLKAKSQMLLKSDGPHQQMIERCSSAKEAWEMLEGMYRSKVTANLVQLKRKFTNLRKQPDESVQLYIARAMALRDDLNAAGSNETERDLVLQVVAGLPDEYETVSIMLESRKPEELTLDNITTSLVLAEQRLQRRTEGTETGAFYAAGPSGQRYAAGNSRQPTRGNASAQAGNPNANKECYYCHEVGHIKAECPNRDGGSGKPAQQRPKQQQRKQQKQHRRPPQQLALAATVGELAADVRELFSAAWVLDSGAGMHMTSRIAELDGYRSFGNRQETVILGDVRKLVAYGYGDVKVMRRVDGVEQQVTVKGVRWVPDLKGRLMSISKLSENGYQVLFEGERARVMQDGYTHLTATKVCGVFFVDLVLGKKEPTLVAMASTAEPVTPQLWHRRMGHLGYENLARLAEKGMVTGMGVEAEKFREEAKGVCEPCVKAKQHRHPFPTSDVKPVRPLQLVHMDVCGPLPQSLGGSRYVVTFLDDFSRLSVVRSVGTKDMVPSVVIRVLSFLETQAGVPVRAVRTDRGGEYINHHLSHFFAKRGIEHQTTAPYTPEQNGAAERLNRTLMERVRAMLSDSGLGDELWAEAVSTANYVRNRSPLKGLDKTPHELFFGATPDVSAMRVFGATAYVLTPKKLRSGKLKSLTSEGIFVGYEPHSKAYRILMPDRRVVVSREVVFDESVGAFASRKATAQSDAALSDSTDSSDDAAAGAAVAGGGAVDGGAAGAAVADGGVAAGGAAGVAVADGGVADGGAAGVAVAGGSAVQGGAAVAGGANGAGGGEANGSVGAAVPPARRELPARTRKPPARYGLAAYVESAPDPLTLEEALSSEDAEQWRAAMDDEMQSLHANGTYTLEKPPPGAKPIPLKWVFKKKVSADGTVERYKARLVAKGFVQREGIDFTEVFAPTSKHASLRVLLAVSAAKDWELKHWDVVTAFLNGKLQECVYTEQPPGYESGDCGVVECRLHKALYGLRQAPRAWHIELKGELEKLGFVESFADPGLYVGHIDGEAVYLLIHVDDVIAAGSAERLGSVMKALSDRFKLRDLGDVSCFLGMEVERDRANRTLKLSQRKLATELVARYGVADAKVRSTPLNAGERLLRAGEEDEPLDGQYRYAELVGSLNYLANCTRPDLAQAVGALARHMAKPTSQHWAAAKGVLRYLAGTVEYGLCFGQGGLSFAGYCDSDWAGDVDTRRSTTGYVFVLNGAAVSWSSKLQQTVAASTVEAEYMSAASATREALWLRKLMMDLGLGLECVSMKCDNQGALSLIKHPITSVRSKHIDVQHHMVRERAARGEVKFEYCTSQSMLADVMTKPLPEGKFVFCRDGMGVR